MCNGVDSGLAGIKFSGSVKRYGFKRETEASINKRIVKPKASFLVKNG